MGNAIELRRDFTGEHLRRLARGSRDGAQVRRLLALAVILDGGRARDEQRAGIASKSSETSAVPVSSATSRPSPVQ